MIDIANAYVWSGGWGETQGYGDSATYVFHAPGWVRIGDLTNISAQYLLPTPAGAPPAPGVAVSLAGFINGQTVNLWGPVYVDSLGVFYGTAKDGSGWFPLLGTTADGRQWTAALIAQMLAGTATATAQAAAHNASSGFIGDLLSNPLFQLASAAYGLYSAYTYFGAAMPASGVDYAAQATAAQNEMLAQAAAQDAAVQAAQQAAEIAAQAQAAAAAEQAAQDAAIQAAQQAAAQQAAADAAQTAAQQAAADAAAQATAQANEIAAQAAQQAAAQQAAADAAAANASAAVDTANAASQATSDAINQAAQAAQAANDAASVVGPVQPAYAGAGSAQADWVTSADLPAVTSEATGFSTAGGSAAVTAATGGALTTAGTAAAGAAASGLPSWVDAATISKAAAAAAGVARLITGQTQPTPGAINPTTGLPYGIMPGGVAPQTINAQTISRLLPFGLVAAVLLLALPARKK